jgi:hypothetical protein
MSTQRTCHVTNSITFSQALAVGLTHYDWLHKTEYEIAGQEAVHASHSVLPESVEAQRTRDTFGPLFGGLSPSADLARSSGSRLRALTALNGSPEYDLTWSVWDMPFGEPIIRLRALGHRTGGNGCSGWPTPNCSERGPESKASKDKRGSGGVDLQTVAKLAGWPTPMAQNPEGGSCDYSRQVEVIAGVRESKNSPKALGPIPNGSHAAMEKRGVLNPALSAWLMGYPEEIIYCVDWETR